MDVGAAGDAQALVVEKGPGAFLGGEEFIGDRIIGDGGDDFALALQRHGDGKERQGMHEVGGAVDGINDEAVIGIGAGHGSRFLHEEAIARAGLFEFGAEHFLAALVGGGHIVAGAFDRDLEVAELAEIALHAAGGLADGGDHDGHGRGGGHGDILVILGRG